MYLTFFLPLILIFVAGSDWPQKNHDGSFSSNVDHNMLVDRTGIWFSPFQRNNTMMADTAWAFQPVVSAVGSVFYPGPKANFLSANNLYAPQGSQQRYLWSLNLTTPLVQIDPTVLPATFVLSHDQSILYAMYVSKTNFILFGVDTTHGVLKWWVTSEDQVVGDFVLHGSTSSPSGYLTIPLAGFVDVFIPPIPGDTGLIMYTSRVRSRLTVPMNVPYNTPLGANGKIHMLYSFNDTFHQYSVVTELGEPVASMFLPLSKQAQLVMVTPSLNSGVIKDKMKTIIIFLNNNQLTVKSEDNLIPATFLTNNANPVPAGTPPLPFILFLFQDPKQGNKVFFQYSPEPIFDTAAVWLAPADPALTFKDEVAVSTDSAGFLNGIIYVRTQGKLAAIHSHNGQMLWQYDIPASPQGIVSPVLASITDNNGISKYILLVTTATDGKNSFTEVGCCSDNGYCLNTQTQCQCHPNFFGTACQTFCDVALCEGTTQANGTCSAAGCVCKPNHYGLNCAIECLAATTCNGRGTCNTQGTCTCKNTLVQFYTATGAHCEMQSLNYLLIGCIGGGGLVVVLIIVITVVLCTRNKKKKNKYDLINN